MVLIAVINLLFGKFVPAHKCADTNPFQYYYCLDPQADPEENYYFGGQLNE